MNKLNEFIKRNYLLINKVIIYFLILSMSLFLSTDYFPIIEVALIFVCIYILYFCILNKLQPLKAFVKSSFFIWYILFWVTVIIMTVIRNSEQMEVLIKTLIVFTIYIGGFGILYTDKKTRDYIDIINMFEIIAVFLCFWILIFECPLLVKGERIGFSVMIGNPNSAGTLLSVYIFAIVYKVIKSRNIKDIGALILCMLLILLTGSKKAIMMSAVSFIMFLFQDGKIVAKRLLYFVIVFIVFIVLCFNNNLLYENIGRRFLSLFGEMGLIEFQTDHSSELRTKYIDKAIELWKEHPIVGGGYDNFRVNSSYNTYSHNNYTELLSAVGLFGTIIYYSYYTYLIKKNISIKYTENIMYILFVISVFIGDIGAVTFSVYPIYYMMLIIINLGTKDKGRDILNGK